MDEIPPGFIEHERRGIIAADFNEKHPKQWMSLLITAQQISDLELALRHIHAHNVDIHAMELHVHARMIDLQPAIDDLEDDCEIEVQS